MVLLRLLVFMQLFIEHHDAGHDALRNVFTLIYALHDYVLAAAWWVIQVSIPWLGQVIIYNRGVCIGVSMVSNFERLHCRYLVTLPMHQLQQCINDDLCFWYCVPQTGMIWSGVNIGQFAHHVRTTEPIHVTEISCHALCSSRYSHALYRCFIHCIYLGEQLHHCKRPP